MSEVQNQAMGRYNSSSFSIIGEAAVYRGDVEFEGVLQINGDFFGNIKGNGDLVIGLSGRIRSVVEANNVIISGLVCGNVYALGRVGIKSSAIVIGDIQAASLVVEEGSTLHGKLEILEREEGRKVARSSLFSQRKPANKLENKPADIVEAPAANDNEEDAQGQELTGSVRVPGETEKAAVSRKIPEEMPEETPGKTPAKISEETPDKSHEPAIRKGKYSVWN